MQPLLLLLCLGLIAALRAQDPLALDEGDQDLSGTWYVKAVTTNMDKPERKPDSVGPITIVTQDGGNLEVSLSFLIKGQCHTLDAVLEKTEEPGRYTAFGGRSVAQVTPLKEKDHFVMVCEGVMHGKAFRHFKLLGREPETNPAALEEFQKVARAKGFTTEDIVIPRLGESCSPETD
ncbi:lipocalin-1-like [Ochotona curzoniae]|uniref:lipocalin-1-like n=1 Tax=Ochotona curzoniae TaxID=130825 RepID=UPI001B3464D8|nr:lipocalin-1-like [Ochotona curzoniae]